MRKSYSQKRRRPIQTKIPLSPSPRNVDVHALLSEIQRFKRQYGKIRFAITANEAAGVIDYKVHATTKDSFEQMLDAIRPIRYNEFDGMKVARVLEELADEGLIADVKYGNEGTSAIYITPPFWTHHNILGAKGKNRKYTDKERRMMLKRIMEKMKDANPDELSVVNIFGEHVDPDDPSKDPAYMSVRAWWD